MEYYPGSKQRIPRTPEEEVQAQAEKIIDPLEGEPFTTYNVKNVPVKFYGIGVLAKVLGRKAGTIRKWETEGVIPKASFQIANDQKDPRSRRRLYTRKQVISIYLIAKEEGLLDTAKHITSTKFSERVLKGWPFA